MTVSAAPAQPGGITGVASYLKVAQVLHILFHRSLVLLYIHGPYQQVLLLPQVKVLLPLPLIIHVRSIRKYYCKGKQYM